MEIIIFAPPNWQPVVLFDKGTANDWVANRGYRFAPPESAAKAASMPVVNVAPIPTVQPDTSSLVNVNTADLSALTALPKLGIATAKKVVSGRPFRTVEDLIELKVDVDWMAIANRICF